MADARAHRKELFSIVLTSTMVLMTCMRFALALALFTSALPLGAGGQEPWTVTITTSASIPIGSCSAVRLDVFDPRTRDIPRSANGDRVTIADFDIAITGGAVAAEWQDGYHVRACACQGGSVGGAGLITATYPSASLAQGYRVPGVSAQATTTFSIGRPDNQVNPPSCVSTSPRPSITRTPLPAGSTTLATKPATKPIATAPAPIARIPVAPAPVAPAPLAPAPIGTMPKATTTSTPVLFPSSPIFPTTTTGAPTDAVGIAPGGTRATLGVVPTGFRLVPNAPIIASLIWDEMPNAVTYSLRRGVGGSVPVERVTRPAAGEKGARDTIPDPRDTYLYSLFVTYADGSFNTSPTVAYVSAPLQNPSGFTARHAGEGNVIFGWNPVPGAKSYRLDGPGFPSTGSSVADSTSATFATPAGANSWKLTALYQGNFADYANPATASAVVRVLPPHPPWLAKNNGVGSQDNVQMPREGKYHCFSDNWWCTYESVLPNQLQHPYDPNYATFLGASLEGDNNVGDVPTKDLVGLYAWLAVDPGFRLWNEPIQFSREAVYGNPLDLGVGRRSFCAQVYRTQQLPGMYTVCYAAAHGIAPGEPGFNDSTVITRPGEGQGEDFLLSMVITKEPTGSVFMVFGPSEAKVSSQFAGTISGKYKLSPTVTLDTEGPKYVPHACLSCHGGKYNETTRKVDGASFLPIDPGLQSFASEADKSMQQERIRRINEIIAKSGSAPAVVSYINGLYGNQVSLPGRTAIPDFVPTGWQNQSGFYRTLVKPHCATCHLAAPASWNFASWDNFKENAALIQVAVCKAHTMPHAELQYKAFWTKDTGPLYLPGLLATTLNWEGTPNGAPPSCP